MDGDGRCPTISIYWTSQQNYIGTRAPIISKTLFNTNRGRSTICGDHDGIECASEHTACIVGGIPTPESAAQPVTNEFHGAHDYTYYRKGSSPLIFSAPHGGYLKPDSIPIRHDGCYIEDSDECDWTNGCTKTPFDGGKCGASITGDSYTQSVFIIHTVHATHINIYKQRIGTMSC